MTIKEFFEGFASMDFWFSKGNVIHSLTHIAVGMGISIIITLIFHKILPFNMLYLLCLFMVGMFAFNREYTQYWVWKKTYEQFYRCSHDGTHYSVKWTDYDPQDQIRDFLTYLIGCLVILFWLI